MTRTAALSAFARWLVVSTVAGMLLAGALDAFSADSDGHQDVTPIVTVQPQAGQYRVHIPAVARDGLLPAGQQSFVTSAAASVRNGVVTITGTVRSASAGEYVIDFELHAPNGDRVDQQWFENELFRAGETRSFTISWRPPAGAPSGTYTVRMGVFAPGPEWAILYHWNNDAATFRLP